MGELIQPLRLTAPICECDDWHCDESLGITWEEYLPLRGLYISSLCESPKPKLPVVESYPTYTIYELDEANLPEKGLYKT